MHVGDALVMPVDGFQDIATGKSEMSGIEQQRNAGSPEWFMKASSSWSNWTTAAMW